MSQLYQLNYHLKTRRFVVGYIKPVVQLFKTIKVATMTISVTNESHHVPTTKTDFVVSKDEWDTKKGTGKSMNNELYIQRHGKRHLSG